MNFFLKIPLRVQHDVCELVFLGLACWESLSVIEKTSLLPSKIGNLGIEFTVHHKTSLIVIILGAVVYFLIEFFIYALSDFTSWQLNRHSLLLRRKAKDNRASLYEGVEEDKRKGIPNNQDVEIRQLAARSRLEKVLDKAMIKYMRPYWQMAGPLGWIRSFLEFAFPILFAGYTIYLLVRLIGTI